jgi:hypothetical protein
MLGDRDDGAADEALEYLFLAREIEIDGALAQPGTPGDVLDARRREPFLDEEIEGGVEDFVGAGLGPAPEFRSALARTPLGLPQHLAAARMLAVLPLSGSCLVAHRLVPN